MFELNDLQLIRVALDHIAIKGADAQILAILQSKVEREMVKLTNPTEKPTPPPLRETSDV